LDPVKSGRVRVGAVWDSGRPPWVRLHQGVGLLSEDRKDEGLALELSIADNVTLSLPKPFSRFGWVSRRKQDELTDKWIEALSIRCRNARQPAAELSGGNQQKVAIARLLHHDVDVLLLDEPARGVDVGSKVEVYRLLGELAARGKALLFVSSYVPELLGVCDRIAVMHRGVLGETRDVAQHTERSILDEAARGPAP
ncbi:MAG: ATP-binding cassette domain-containing protein, partial [Polyangiales bacterium]